jgi:hypothetical protein
MLMTKAWTFALAFALVSAVQGTGSAQSGGTFEITRSTVDGGGGRSSGGDFELVGTIAQPDANPTIATGGTFSLRGGFHVAGGGAPLADPIFADGFEGP